MIKRTDGAKLLKLLRSSRTLTPQIGLYIHLGPGDQSTYIDMGAGPPKLGANVQSQFKRNLTKINKFDTSSNKPDDFHSIIDNFT